jgi:predicted kinase
MMKNKLIIIRGNACSGKSTVAEELRKKFKNQKKVAIIHTTMFYWGIVEGDNPAVVMENTKRILDNYLKNGYNVVLEGTLANKDKKGRLHVDGFLKVAKKYRVSVKQFFFKADFCELKKREKIRRKISLKRLKEFYDKTSGTVRKDEIVIDTTGKSIRQVVNEVWGAR